MRWLKTLWHRESLAPRTQPSNAYDLIGGDRTIRAIAHYFYQEMQQRQAVQPLLALHQQPLPVSEQKLYEFLSGWLGGPPLFQQKYGNPMLRARHLHIAIDVDMRDQWLLCMKTALAKAVRDETHQQVIYQAISQLADHMRNQ